MLSPEELARTIDLTLLKPEATPSEIIELCRQADRHGFAAVCVNPCYVPLAVRHLSGTVVKVCTVIGFPLGSSMSSVKAMEAKEAVLAGAGEVDVVMNIGFLKSGNEKYVNEELTNVLYNIKETNTSVTVKIILETCLLNEIEKVTACRLALSAGADYVKTSTGFNKGGATISDVMLMRKTVGERCGVKAAGGIRDLSTALAMLGAGATRLGTSAGTDIMEEYKKTFAL